jgi:hypothetical protein
MISREKMHACLGRLGMLQRFPAQERVQLQIGKLLNELCANDDEAVAFVSRVLDQHDAWPGPAALRQIHCGVASDRAVASRPDDCDKCKQGYRSVFKIVEHSTRREEIIFPEGDALAKMRQESELCKKYRGSKTHDVYTACFQFCECPAGKHAEREYRRVIERNQQRV